MRKRYLTQNPLTARSQPQQYFSAVGSAACSFQQAMRLQAIHEFPSAVVLDLKAFGKHTDSSIA